MVGHLGWGIGQGILAAGGGAAPPPRSMGELAAAGWWGDARVQVVLWSETAIGSRWHEGDFQGQYDIQYPAVIVHSLHCLGQDYVLLPQCLQLFMLKIQELKPKLPVLLVPYLLVGNVLCLPGL